VYEAHYALLAAKSPLESALVAAFASQNFVVGPAEKVHDVNAANFFARHGVVHVVRMLDMLLGEALARSSSSSTSRPAASRTGRFGRLAGRRSSAGRKGRRGSRGIGDEEAALMALVDSVKGWFAEEVVGVMECEPCVRERFWEVRGRQLLIEGYRSDNEESVEQRYVKQEEVQEDTEFEDDDEEEDDGDDVDVSQLELELRNGPDISSSKAWGDSMRILRIGEETL
jgi:hypothetical protein